MINKSLVIKNKFYLFFSFLFTFFLFVYLLYFLINGPRGLLKYFQLKNQNFQYSEILLNLTNENNLYLDRIKRLQPNTVDLDYLDEKIRENSGFLKDNEIIVVFE
tara:strand:- start:125 stop:439 length:315 start_codon:yes stop_codon:yes gene_type:complete